MPAFMQVPQESKPGESVLPVKNILERNLRSPAKSAAKGL
jgi:hypothetical protein